MRTLTQILALSVLFACNGDKDDDTGTDTDSPADTDTDAPADTDTADPSVDVKAAMAGDWSSASCEDLGGGNYLLRDFTFSATAWDLDGRVFGDAGCTAETFRFHVDGPYEILGASATLAGVYEADFGTDTKVVTPTSQGIADYLNSQPAGTCGTTAWIVGVEQSVAETGCMALGLDAVADCPEEHDLVHVDGDTLTLGDRSASLCVDRPTSISAYPLARQ